MKNHKRQSLDTIFTKKISLIYVDEIIYLVFLGLSHPRQCYPFYSLIKKHNSVKRQFIVSFKCPGIFVTKKLKFMIQS